MKWLSCFLSLALIAIIFAGCATTPPPAKPEKKPVVIQYRTGKEFAALPLKYTATKESLTATTADGKKLQFTPNTSILVFQECKIYLPETVSLTADGVYHTGSRTLQLLNALIQYPDGRHFGRRILVDPGHGGSDQGARGKKFLEKDLNLALAQAIVTCLCERGFYALLSRSDDRFYTLLERVQKAESCDIFISIHHNATEKTKCSGIETFAPKTPRDQQTESIVLAFLVQRNIVRATGEIDRGVKTNNLYVLEHTTIPAILLEAGFIDNPEEEAKLNDPFRRQKIANAVADALVTFYQSSAPKAKSSRKK